ncbi:MAG: 2-(1,2-epoxy-1,2-dihydrophenyl)acetyl-CoA isomerase PaaG [Gemmatimonadota bacterium]
MPDNLRAERNNGVERLTLNRPEVLNSFNLAMAQELQQALDDAAAASDVRAILLTGEGRGFCAGQDLSAIPADPSIPLPDLADIVAQQYNPIVSRLRAIEKPVVCAVNGVAAGAGANLAFACDIVLASRDATFIQSFTRIGLVPDSGGTFWLPRLAGQARAAGLMLTGEKLTAERALHWGLIWEVCDPGLLMERALALATTLAEQPTRALGLTKRLLNATWSNDLYQQLELEKELQGEAGRTDDFAEGVRAFVAKRRPTFRGR